MFHPHFKWMIVYKISVNLDKFPSWYLLLYWLPTNIDKLNFVNRLQKNRYFSLEIVPNSIFKYIKAYNYLKTISFLKEQELFLFWDKIDTHTT